jgi:hypothetical protein
MKTTYPANPPKDFNDWMKYIRLALAGLAMIILASSCATQYGRDGRMHDKHGNRGCHTFLKQSYSGY